MTRHSTIGAMLIYGALVSVPLSSAALAQDGCQKNAQAEGARQNLAQGENTSAGGGMYGRQYAQAEGNRRLAQGQENTSSGGGMYGRQYAQAEGTPRNRATGRLAPGSAPCP
ncbi:MAG: hypothetical protein J2P47_04030 [Acetobacteraceae bacterium]|nr:hypothetical protein [Acetobacteraceae bacterium]